MHSANEVRTSIKTNRSTQPRVHTVDLASVPFSSVFSDHMFTAEYHDGQWNDGEIQAYGPISVAPSISALHYGVSVFEGMKAHKSDEGRPLLFRARENSRRLARSAARLAMATVPESLFLDGLRELVRLDQAWIPDADAGALYIRPILFSVDPSIRVKPAESCRFLILTFPFGAYFSAPVDVVVSERYVRAFPGGTGDTKPAGNYAAALLADQDAREMGFQAVLWLDAIERRYVEESGVMNVFFVFRDQILTPALSGTILPGITRDSVITLLRDMGLCVKEDRISIDDVFKSYRRGELLECFGTGTAATVSQVRRIRYKDQTLELTRVDERMIGAAVRERLIAIMTGKLPDPYDWVEAL
jgi:branched-chain amino acid aminotransferase